MIMKPAGARGHASRYSPEQSTVFPAQKLYLQMQSRFTVQAIMTQIVLPLALGA